MVYGNINGKQQLGYYREASVHCMSEKYYNTGSKPENGSSVIGPFR